MLEVKSIKAKVESQKSKVDRIGVSSSFSSFIVPVTQRFTEVAQRNTELSHSFSFFTCLILFLFSLSVSAQQFYPIQVRSEVRSPSVFLEDYKDPNNFRVQVTLTDLTIGSLDVILKVKFNGDEQGAGFESTTGIPLTLNGGITYTLNRNDLDDLLSAGNLNQIPSSLPEGTYNISFTVTEQNTGVVVSNSLTDFTIVLVELLDPPLLTYPAKGKVLDPEVDGVNYMFSWTPSTFALNPQVQVKYRINMAEIPAGRNPYDAFLTNAFTINQEIDGLNFNSFTYDQTLFSFEAGHTYAWQVEAYEEKIIDGVLVEVTNRFRNQGRSDVFTFSVKENCPQLFVNDDELVSNPLSRKQEVKLSWIKDGTHKLFEVKYRPQGSIQNWVFRQTESDSLHLGADVLMKSKTYEYFVKAKCTGWQEAVYGGTFMLPASNCEAPEPIIISSNDENGIALSWEKIPSANSYTLTYTNSNTGETKTEEGLTEESFLLAPIKQGSYTIRVDGVCGDVSAQGEELELAFDEKHFPGDCPVPSPFLFLAKRPDTVTTSLYAELSWPSMDLHESFSITYWNSLDSIPKPETLSSTEPSVLAADIATGEFYQYTLEFTCVGGKKTTTPIGGFRVEGGGITQTLSPPTADCFPPAIHSAETRNETSARIDWKGVSGAEEYMVLYYKEGEPENEQVFMTTAANARLTDLEPNATYHYKIRCRCNGEYSIDSDPGKFDLTESYSNNKCDSISDLKVSQVTETEIQLTWTYPQLVKENYDEHSAFTILYKENGQIWKDAYTEDFHLDDSLKTMYAGMGMVKKTIDQLSSGTSYDIEVTARCGTEEAAKSNDPLSATTKEIQDPDCGSGGSCDRSITEPIEKPKEEIDTIAIADYLVKIKTIEADPRGSNLWMGTGQTEAPMIGFSEHVRFDVTFDSVFINNVACVVEGNVDLEINLHVLNEEQQAWVNENMDKVDRIIDEAKAVSQKATELIDKGQEYGEKAFNYFHGGDDVGRAKTGGLGETAVSSSALNSISVDGDAVTIGGTSYPKSELPKLFKEDGSNKVYSVGPDGSKTEVGHYDESLLADMDSVPSTNRTLTFKANKNAQYAFDAFREVYKGSIAMLPHYLRLDTNYYSAKAITPGATDLVDFELSSGDEDNLTFINRKGFVFNLKGNKTLRLAGGPATDAQEVLALYDNGSKKELVGALLLASYPRLEKKVVLVTLRLGDALDNKVAGIQEQLNKAYNPIGINYTVEVDKSFDQNSDWCETGDCAFSTSGSGALSNDYTGTEARIRDAYVNLKAEELEAETAYLFALGITNPNPGEEALEGKMNFEKQFGFLYAVVQQQSAKTGRILAHELAHGNYKLHHIFEKMYLGEAARNSNNLLSYNSSTEALALNKMQWDVIHDPGVTWGIFKRDEDQGLQRLNDYSKIEVEDQSNGFFMLTPSGTPIFLPEESEIAAAVICGPLLSFKLNDELYIPSFTNGNFLGYFGVTSQLEYQSIASMQIGTNDIFSIRDFEEKIEAENETNVPIFAKLEANRLKSIDIQGNNSNGISYCHTKAISLSVDVNNRWELIAVNNQNTFQYNDEFKQLPVKSRSSCGHFYGSDYDMPYVKFGGFADELVEVKEINYDGKQSGYRCIVTKEFIESVLAEAPELVQSKLKVEFNGKSFNQFEPIFLNQSESIPYSFSLLGYAEEGAISWKLKKGRSYSTFSTDFQWKNGTDNPFVISQKLTKGTYILESDVRYSDEAIEGESFSTVVISSNIELTNLDNFDNSQEPINTALAYMPENIIRVGAGEDIFIRYQTPLRYFQINVLSDQDENGNIAPDPKSFVKVILVKEYTSQMTGEPALSKIAENLDGGSGSLQLQRVGDIANTEIENETYFIQLVHKETEEVLANKKIRVEIIPRETITSLTVTEKIKYNGTKEECKDYDEAINREAKIGESLYVVVCPDCEDENTKKTFDFEIKTSNNNIYNAPVHWEFQQQQFSDKNNYHDGEKSDFSIHIDDKKMKVRKDFHTQLSEIKNEIIPDINTVGITELNIKGIKIPLNVFSDVNKVLRLFPQYQVDKLSFLAKAKVFNQSVSVPVVFVSSQKDEFTFDFLEIECENKNGKTECETVGLLKKVISFQETYNEVKTKYLDALKPFGTNQLSEPIKKSDDTRKYDFDFYKPTYTHYFKEKENSNLYQEVHEFDLTVGAPTLSSEVVFDVTKSNPVSGVGKWMLNNIFKIDFAAGIKIGSSIGFDLGVNFPYYCDKGGANNDCYSGSTSFKGEINASMTAIPFVSVQAVGYYSEVSGNLEVPCNATINYVPENVSFNFQLSTKDVTITPKFVLKQCQECDDIFAFETEGWTIFEGGLIYEYDSNK